MQGIESCFDKDATTVAKLYTQTAVCRRCIDQFNRQQLCGWCCDSASAFQISIIVQRVKSYSTRFAERLPLQPALFKIPYQAFRFCPAPTMSRNNRSRFPHASTSTCNHACEKSGFARRDTVNSHYGAKQASRRPAYGASGALMDSSRIAWRASKSAAIPSLPPSWKT